jgi:uncharacterized membrane protein YsdA (DUF1294 family)
MGYLGVGVIIVYSVEVGTMENAFMAIFGTLGIALIILGLAIPDYYLYNFLPLYLAWLVVSGITSFFVYGYDKFKAVRGGYRVPENLLHLFALSGGFVGCALGMIVFRHKIRKLRFTAIIALAFLIHGLIVLYLQVCSI